jgi:putative membrane protein
MSSQKPKLAVLLDRISYAVTFLVLLLVFFMRKIHINSSIDFSFLPAVYSVLNAVAAIILIYAYVQIRKKKIIQHKRAMITAIIISLLFLLMYVLYHITTPDTAFCREGWIRPVYFFLLITHVILAAVSFPFILFTFVRGYTNMITQHRKFARKVFPVWLYVAITGPIIYLLLYPCYS